MPKASRIVWLVLFTLMMSGSRSVEAEPPLAGKLLYLQGQVAVRLSGPDQ